MAVIARSAVASDFAVVLGELLAAHTLEIDGAPSVMWTFVKRQGRVWAFLDFAPGVTLSKPQGLALMHAMRQSLEGWEGHTVSAPCQKRKYPQAERVLGVLGFVRTNEIWNDAEVWVWE